MMFETIDQFGVQWLLGSDSAVLDHVALTMTNALVWIPLYLALLYLIIKNNSSMPQICLCIACAVLCVVLSSILSNVIVKPLVERPRPCNTPEVMYLAQIAGNLRSKDFSFFSSHAANTMSLAVFFTLLVRSRALSVALVLWSLLNCWTRLYLGQHYVTDILAGLLCGIAMGLLSYLLFRRLFRRLSPSHSFISTHYTRSGYSQLDIDTVLSVLMLVTACALIPIY